MKNTDTSPRKMSFLQHFMSSAWLAGLLAVLEMVFGFILLSFPFILGTSAVWVCGFVLVIVGIARLVQAFMYAYNRWWNFPAGIVFIALGVLMVLLPVLSLELWTLMLGCAFTLGGIVRLGIAISKRKEQGSAWRFFNALVTLILGVLVLWQWPASSLWLIGTFIAIEMIFSGWTLLFLALTPPDMTTDAKTD